MKTLLVASNFTELEMQNIVTALNYAGIELNMNSVVTTIQNAKIGLQLQNPWMGCLIKIMNDKDLNNADSILKFCMENAIITDVFCRSEYQKEVRNRFPELRTTFYNQANADVRENVDLFIRNLFPKSFKELCRKAATYNGKSTFPNIEFSLTETSHNSIDGDLYVYAEVADKLISGSISVTVNSKKLRQLSEFYASLNVDVILDSFKEYVNQLHGTLSYNLNKYMQLNLIVSLPVGVLNLAKPLHTIKSNLLKPSFQFQDTSESILIKFEFITLGIHPQIRDLAGKSLEFSTPNHVELF